MREASGSATGAPLADPDYLRALPKADLLRRLPPAGDPAEAVRAALDALAEDARDCGLRHAELHYRPAELPPSALAALRAGTAELADGGGPHCALVALLGPEAPPETAAALVDDLALPTAIPAAGGLPDLGPAHTGAAASGHSASGGAADGGAAISGPARDNLAHSGPAAGDPADSGRAAGGNPARGGPADGGPADSGPAASGAAGSGAAGSTSAGAGPADGDPARSALAGNAPAAGRPADGGAAGSTSAGVSPAGGGRVPQPWPPVGIALEAPGRRPSDYADAFRLAASAGLHRAAAVGDDARPLAESPPGDAVAAVDVLGCERLLGGYTVLTDPRLVARFRAAGTPFAVTPFSPDRLLATRRLRDIRALLDAGLTVALTSAGARLSDSWERLAAFLRLDRPAADRLAATTLTAAWRAGP